MSGSINLINIKDINMCDIYKLHDWIDLNKINWHYLSGNSNAIYLLERNMNKINWDYLSGNPNAIHLLEKNMDKINWHYLSGNPNAIHLLEKNIDKIDWYALSQNPNATHILEKNTDKIDYMYFSQNPNIFTYDYDKMKINRINISIGMTEELIKTIFNPKRLLRISEKYNIDFDQLIEIY